MSLIGVVYGTLLVNFGKTGFSETFPELWLFLMGGLFISVVMFFPNGLAGIYEKYAVKVPFLRRLSEEKPKSLPKSVDDKTESDVAAEGAK
jgi:urea transport system permease protein